MIPRHVLANIHTDAARVLATGEVQVGEDNMSIVGEEDPGAALDLLRPATQGPEAYCPWPRESSA